MSDQKPTRPVMLCILDGWGWREDADNNAVRQANTPVFDRIWSAGPHAFLSASGGDVGLPDGQFGNSEVGHINIGAGRVVDQDLPRIDKAIQDGSLAENPVLAQLIETLKSSGGALHLMGLVSPGGVHSHQRHIAALAELVSKAGIAVRIHAFLDGRDVAPQSAAQSMADFLSSVEGLSDTKLVSLCGRYFAMDRDTRWERVAKAYHLLVEGTGEGFTDPIAAIEASYAADTGDEFVEPLVHEGYTGMADGDAILMANFRADRAREILTAFLDDGFDGFERPQRPALAAAVGMVEYSSALAPLMTTLFEPQELTNVLGEVVSKAGAKQLRAAETEKYPHVTFFLNGGEEVEYEGEERILVPSPKVATYDLQPEMSAPELTNKVAKAIETGKFDLIVINYANPDMVGHTGDLAAAVKACETVDTGLGQLLEVVEAQGGAALVTADHGNCETMRDPETGGPHTAHTTNLVPVALVGGAAGATLRDGRLADLAPSLLDLMGIDQPSEMTGQSLLRPANTDQSAA
ncbi:MAG: 2,3-bisphosphoglycerate-independent phosphoglycerate mutase [Alphaproteobacteria bacterium]|nr:2,3-bisphosphoglycerate-independent phosphoglycerate mutase [Alphaproteobacteria bacterium SS10]